MPITFPPGLSREQLAALEEIIRQLELLNLTEQQVCLAIQFAINMMPGFGGVNLGCTD